METTSLHSWTRGLGLLWSTEHHIFLEFNFFAQFGVLPVWVCCESSELQHSETIVFSDEQPVLWGIEFDVKCSTLVFGCSAQVWVLGWFVALWVSRQQEVMEQASL